MIVALVGAVGTAACGSGDGAAADASTMHAPAGPSSTRTQAAGLDWRQVRDYFAAEFQQTCTGLGGADLGRCVESLAHRSHSLLDMTDGVPGDPSVSELWRNAQQIVDEAKTFRSQSCRSDAEGGCAQAVGTISRDAHAIYDALQAEAGGG